MGRRSGRSNGRPIDGILLLDKQPEVSSNAALQTVKRLFGARKAGHTGNLDPLATGMLPICFGNATKISAFLLDAEKTYQVRMKLGQKTTTGDAEGEVVASTRIDPAIMDRLPEVLDRFRGEIQQVPPMYSAVKHQGERLYRLARQGIEVTREPRAVVIHELELLEAGAEEVELRMRCSKGTYVRTLVEDLAEAMGSYAHVCALRRLAVGPYDENARLWAVPELETLRSDGGLEALDHVLLPIDSALGHWPAVELPADSVFMLSQGSPVLVPRAPDTGWVRIYGPGQSFLGMGEMLVDGRVAPRRMMRAGSR